MKIKVLFEDKNILVIDKPVGIAVHSDGRSKEKTLVDWILEKYPKMKNVGEPMRIRSEGEIENFSSCALPGVPVGTLGAKNFQFLPRPGIVHRLDKDTSGVLVLAKNQKVYEFLKSQFQNREIKKVYHTVVSGWVKDDRGTVNKHIGRSPNDFRKRLAGRGARGELKEAVTEYTVLKRFIDRKNKFTYLEVRPKTGRTHQIRVHMKFLNHPVVGDELYNPNKPTPKGFTRLALHAKSITFNLPMKIGKSKVEILKIESELPEELKKLG